MAADSFSAFPDDSRIWVLALAEAAAADTASRLESALGEVLGHWRHKGQAYEAAWEVRENRLILVVEPNMATAPSGCAIDGMLRKVRTLVGGLGTALLGEDRVLVRLEGALADLGRSELAGALDSGRIGPETPVLDLSLHHLGQLREGRLERPLARTWVGRVHKVAVAGS